MSNFPYIPTPRTIYVSTEGNDSLDGTSPQYAVKTLARATALAAALTPTLESQAAIIASDYNRFEENLNIPDNVQVIMPASTIIGNITAGENGQLQISTLVCPSGTGYSTNGKSNTGFQALAVIALQFAPVTAISISAGSSASFITVNLIVLRADSSIGVSYTSGSIDSKSLSIGVIDIGDANFTPDNCTGVLVSDASSDVIFLRGGKIRDTGGTGHIGVHVDKGNVVDEGRAINMTAGNSAITLGTADSDYTVDGTMVYGDISTALGSYFAVNINRYSFADYFVNILGDADGYIGGIRLGTYVVGDEDTYNFNIDRVRTQVASVGTLRIADLTLKEITVANFAYNQTSSTSIDTDVSIVDAATGLITYFTLSKTIAATGFSGFNDLVADTALPASGSIDLRIVCSKVGGGNSAIQDLSVNVTVDLI